MKGRLTGLAYRDAAVFLPMGDKLETLEYGADQPPVSLGEARAPAGGRIALINDGRRGLGAILAYSLNAGLQQGARIDLLVHRGADPDNTARLAQ